MPPRCGWMRSGRRGQKGSTTRNSYRPPPSEARARAAASVTSARGTGGTNPARPSRPASSAARLEELDRVARRILQEDLRAARAGHDVVPKPYLSGAPESSHLGRDVLDDEVDPVPATGSRLATVRHRPASRAGRAAQQQPQVTESDVGE